MMFKLVEGFTIIGTDFLFLFGWEIYEEVFESYDNSKIKIRDTSSGDNSLCLFYISIKFFE